MHFLNPAISLKRGKQLSWQQHYLEKQCTTTVIPQSDNLVFLMFLKQRLGPSDIFGKVIGGDDGLHVVDPADEVTVVGQKAMQVVGVFQVGTTFVRLQACTSHDTQEWKLTWTASQ